MPGAKYRSIRNPRQYEAVRNRGASKTKAARVANARSTDPKPRRRRRSRGRK